MRTRVGLAALLLVACARVTTGQELTIGIIDFYGLKNASASPLREALTFKEGAPWSMEGEPPSFVAESEARLSQVSGVQRARIQPVCCDQGRAIIFVGIEEGGTASLRFHDPPTGSVRLPREIMEAEEAYQTALFAAVRRGDAAEDDSKGHALSHDPATRTVQERFVSYADRHLPLLRRVLRESSDGDQRALAAQVLGYVTRKQAVVDELVRAMSDPSDLVRNNAMRALMVFAEATALRPAVHVPFAPFVPLLRSLAWSDRNKASGALFALSRNRDPRLLAALRSEAVEPLVEMARWRSEGHATAAFYLLGRTAGYSEEAIQAAWSAGDRETVIKAALDRR
jgi:HEAT repeats